MEHLRKFTHGVCGKPNEFCVVGTVLNIAVVLVGGLRVE